MSLVPRHSFIRLLSTCGGIGFLPFAPGTFGTLPGVLLAWILSPLPWFIQLSTCLALLALAVPIASAAEKIFQRHDPPCVVIDEAAAFPLAVFLLPPTWQTFLAAFILFRLIDIFKPWPCSHLQRLPSGYGIVADDTAAALLACLFVHLLRLFSQWQ
ncbi:MAG: phosphatidylglycerophosphatase A [Verrucomicrobiae bacterium]|nr:phosphatidylglycerophosphatase A [Verrucomicrobiae bacterium]